MADPTEADLEDPEIVAMARIVVAMKLVPADGKSRVLRWAWSRWVDQPTIVIGDRRERTNE